jgi:hypothetical protein
MFQRSIKTERCLLSSRYASIHFNLDHAEPSDSDFYHLLTSSWRIRGIPKSPRLPMFMRKFQFSRMLVKVCVPGAGRARSGSQQKLSDSPRPGPLQNNVRWCHRRVAPPDHMSGHTHVRCSRRNETMLPVTTLYRQCIHEIYCYQIDHLPGALRENTLNWARKDHIMYYPRGRRRFRPK